MKPKTIVLIHGMFTNPRCWEQWIPYLAAKGYQVLAPAWPGRDKPVEELRQAHPDPTLPDLNLGDVVDHIATVIKGLPEKPWIIGHSMGGLVVQLLLQWDMAAAGVAISPAPPQGVFSLRWSFIKSNFPAINPLLIKQPDLMSFAQFQYVFANTSTLAEQRAAYARYLIPESRAVAVSSLGQDGQVDFYRDHVPLLITAGELDHTIPPSLNRSNYKKYGSSSITDFHEFPGRSHFLIVTPGWEEVADYSLQWLETFG